MADKKNKGGRPKGASPVKGLKISINLPDNGRMTSRQELLISNTIILFKGDIKKTSKFLGIGEEPVSEVYLKYSSQISNALMKELNENKMNQAINESLDIMETHIKELKKKQKANPSNSIYGGDLNSCLLTVDRLVKVKTAQSDSYYKCLSGLNDSVIRSKLAEKAEEGIEFDNGIYAKNQKTVCDMLSMDPEKIEKEAKREDHNSPCKAIDLTTNEEHSYSSIMEFLSEAKLSLNDLYNAKNRNPNPDGSVTVGNWKFIGETGDIRIVNESASRTDNSKIVKKLNSEGAIDGVL